MKTDRSANLPVSLPILPVQVPFQWHDSCLRTVWLSLSDWLTGSGKGVSQHKVRSVPIPIIRGQPRLTLRNQGDTMPLDFLPVFDSIPRA